MPPIPALDGLRAIAILVVLVSHAGLGSMVPGGFGVTIFFFLSGYLITTILRLEAMASGTIDLRRFYAKRFWRIMPPFLITLTVLIALIQSGVLRAPITSGGLSLDYLFLSNYAPEFGVTGSLPSPLWSLDVEEHFYIVFPLFFLRVLTRVPASRAFAICALLCAAILALRIGSALTISDVSRIYYWSHTRMDSILFGCCLALWNNPAIDGHAWRPGWRSAAISLAALLVCLAIRDPFFRETLRYSIQGAALFVLFSFAVQSRGPVARVLGAAWLRGVALLSYTLYLIHVPLIMLAQQHALPAPELVGLALAFAYAGAMYVMVERPISRWRRRSRTPATFPTGAAQPRWRRGAPEADGVLARASSGFRGAITPRVRSRR